MTTKTTVTDEVKLFTSEPDDVYHARSQSGKSLSSHLLSDFRKCPLLYYKKTHGLIEEEERPAFLLGRAVHCLILEGHEKFKKSFAVGGPINPKTGKPFGTATQAFADWAAEIGKPVISQSDFCDIELLDASVYAHPVAVELLKSGTAEQVCRAKYHGVPCQIRIDWFAPKFGIIDLKTCDDLTYFEADARRYGYAHQLAFYQAVLESHPLGMLADVYMIAVEKKEPLRTGVWKISQETLNSARADNESAMDLFLHCRDTDTWPTGYESLRTFEAV